MSLSEKIYLLISSLLGMVAIVYGGNLAWRHPAKFRTNLFFDGGKWFVFILWIYRVTFLLFGLLTLFLFLMTSLSLAGFIK